MTRILVFCAMASVTAAAQNVQPKVFVVDKVTATAQSRASGSGVTENSGEHHSAPVVMAEFSKRCPSVAFTTDRAKADYVLQTQPGGSILTTPNDDVLYISPAKTLGNMVKDVCAYIARTYKH